MLQSGNKHQLHDMDVSGDLGSNQLILWGVHASCLIGPIKT